MCLLLTSSPPYHHPFSFSQHQYVFLSGANPPVFPISFSTTLLCICLISYTNVRSAFSTVRIHFRNAWWYVLGEVVQQEPADVEECLWHVGTEGLILEIKTV